MLRKIQEEQKAWVEYNFGNRPSWQPLLGVVEEVGELAHAYLKMAQGIRISEDHNNKAKDAVGDIAIFLCDFCTASGYDIENIIQETWNEVKKRDWKAYPKNGITE